MPTLSFSFARLEQSLAVGFRIAPEDFPRFRARIKQLQRLGFPAGVNIGRGAKMPYKTEHLLKLATAFALLDTGLTAKLVTDFVEKEWDKFAAAYWAAKGTPAHSSDVFALVRFNALEATTGDDATLTIEDERSKHNFEAAVEHGFAATSYIIVNITRLLRQILSSADMAAQLAHNFMELEIQEWRSEAPPFTLFSDDDEWFRVGHFDERGVVKL